MSAWHLVGIGGAGMSVIAALLAARGEQVSGSDARASANVEALRERGVEVHLGHEAAHVEALPEGARLVISTAVRESNPELLAARARGLEVLHRSRALAWLMEGHRVVAVAGAHGKTTTSAMLAVALREAGLEPSFAIGGSVMGGSDALSGAGAGSGEVFVAEADESDGSFLAYEPLVALVTNVEPDHLDHFGSREAFEQIFADFAARVRPGGTLVACADDAGARRLADRVRAEGRIQVLTYGTSQDAELVLDPGSRVVRLPESLAGEGPTELELELGVPGAHNVLNATGALAVLALLGVSASDAARGLAAFRGTGRRFEDRGSARGVRVVDDYAHHPTEVTALLRAARSVAGSGRVLVLFQPHLFSRTAHFQREFAEALSLADLAVVTDVYAAREDPAPGITGETITQHLPSARFVADRLEAARAVAAEAREGDLVLTVGAGDVTELAPVVLAAVEERA